jgi:hypothetical protein
MRLLLFRGSCRRCGGRKIQQTKREIVAVGTRFGGWTVIQDLPPEAKVGGGWKTHRALVRCDCGVEGIRTLGMLKTTGGCRACFSRGQIKPLVAPPSIGTIFGTYTVIGLPEKRTTHTLKVRARCVCGVEKLLRVLSLQKGKIDDCLVCAPSTQRHKEARGRAWKGHGDISKTYWCRLRNGARTRRLQFDFTIEEAWALFEEQQGLCALSGQPIQFGYATTASLDRIDNTRGYCRDNVQWLHKALNRAKQDLPQEEFIALCCMVSDKSRGGCSAIMDPTDELYAPSNEK